MTPAELKSARKALGLTAEGFARLVHVESGRTVRRWEAGDRDIPGPVIVLTKAILDSGPVRRYFGLTIT
jgi:DNA-binding transcriptional regulator YiaG